MYLSLQPPSLPLLGFLPIPPSSAPSRLHPHLKEPLGEHWALPRKGREWGIMKQKRKEDGGEMLRVEQVPPMAAWDVVLPHSPPLLAAGCP